MVDDKQLKIEVSPDIGTVSALLKISQKAKYLMVLAHGAGAGMYHQFMTDLTEALLQNDIATLRFQFPYMQQGKKRPDSPKKAHQTIRAALKQAIQLNIGLPIIAAGKSFGGRMTSQLAAQEPLEGLIGIVYFGFPLHAPGRNNTDRAAHLADVPLPMLFLQGTRDTLALPDLIKSVCDPLPKATLQFYEGADHSFKTLKRSGVTQQEVIEQMAQKTIDWANTLKD